MTHAQLVTCHGASHDTVTIVQRTMAHKESVKLLCAHAHASGSNAQLARSMPYRRTGATSITISEMLPVSYALLLVTQTFLLSLVLCVTGSVVQSQVQLLARHGSGLPGCDGPLQHQLLLRHSAPVPCQLLGFGLCSPHDRCPPCSARSVCMSVRLLRSTTSDAVCHICCLGQSVCLLPAMHMFNTLFLCCASTKHIFVLLK